jgi:hypothetical protein
MIWNYDHFSKKKRNLIWNLTFLVNYIYSKMIKKEHISKNNN